MANLILCLLTSFLISYAGIPSIIRIASKLSLYDEPNERKTHIHKVPRLGGIAIFGATIFSFTIWSAQYFESQNLFIIAALIIIFFFGLRDDIAPLAPIKKLSGQVIASLIAVMFCDIRLEGLHGLFGIHSMPWLVSVFVSVFAMLFIINAYNFIDGIDGLSSGLGIISSLVFGVLFLVYGDFLMAVLGFALCGALMGFLHYNFYQAKIFMGDTGTMTTGFILSLFAVHFMELTRDVTASFWLSYYYAPVVVLSVLIIPVVDMLRVFIIRIIHLKSPFSADRNHIHHRLLELGLSPAQTCIILYVVNLIFILSAWLLRGNDPLFIFYLISFSAILLTQLPYFVLLIKKRKQIA